MTDPTWQEVMAAAKEAAYKDADAAALAVLSRLPDHALDDPPEVWRDVATAEVRRRVIAAIFECKDEEKLERTFIALGGDLNDLRKPLPR